MSLGLVGDYGSDSSEEAESPQDTPTTPPSGTDKQASSAPLQSADSAPPPSTDPPHTAQYDPFGFTTPVDDVDTSSSDQDSSESEERDATPPRQDSCLPLPDLETPPHSGHKKGGSSVFSNPYKDAEEERLSLLKHHVKEFAPEVKEDKRQRRRQRGRRGRQSQAPPTGGGLFDENDSSESRLGRRKVRSGVGDTLLPPRKFMKVHSRIQAEERPWTT